MSYVTEHTKWLSDAISQETKHLIARFYELADSKQPDAGQLMATQVFSKEATLVAANGTHKGSLEIARSRDNAWSVVTSRKHDIHKVFAGRDNNNLELVLLGTVFMRFNNQKTLEAPFVSHVQIDDSNGAANPRFSYMEVFADTSPISAVVAK